MSIRMPTTERTGDLGQETIPAPAPEVDPARQAQAREYAAIRRRLFFAELALDAVLLIGFLLSGLSAGLRDLTERAVPAGWWWLALLLYLAVLGLGYTLLDLPLSYWGGFVLPHRYGIATESRALWLTDLVRGGLLEAGLGLPLGLVLYGLLRTFPTTWWLLMAGLVLLFTIILGQLAPVLFMPLFNKFTPLEDGDLRRRLMALAAAAGSPVRGVFVMDLSRRTRAANAMFTGIGPTRRIILGDTLLTGYTADEIETVLAHELAHQVHGDLWRGIALQAALTVGGLWLADLGLRAGVTFFGFRGLADPAAFPLLLGVLAAFSLLFLPATNAFSRAMERAADDYALRVTGKPRAFQSMMAKLTDRNLSDAAPPAWVRVLFYSHPPVAERIAAAERYIGREP